MLVEIPESCELRKGKGERREERHERGERSKKSCLSPQPSTAFFLNSAYLIFGVSALVMYYYLLDRLVVFGYYEAARMKSGSPFWTTHIEAVSLSESS